MDARTRTLQVLVVSNNAALARSLELTLRRAGMAVMAGDSLVEFLERWTGGFRLLDMVVLEAEGVDPATVWRLEILRGAPELPQTLLLAGRDTLRELDFLVDRPEVSVLEVPCTSEALAEAVRAHAHGSAPRSPEVVP